MSHWYDTTWDYTLVSRSIGEHSTLMCVCVYVCEREQHFFVEIYLIDQYGLFLSIYFCILFNLPYGCYNFRPKLANKLSVIIWFPTTFWTFWGHHQGCVYCKSDKSFANTLQIGKNEVFTGYTGVMLLRLFKYIYIYIYIYIYVCVCVCVCVRGHRPNE